MTHRKELAHSLHGTVVYPIRRHLFECFLQLSSRSIVVTLELGQYFNLKVVRVLRFFKIA